MATRPTSDRLRETLFNVLAPRLPGARFLDLYAGSGANGLEALSRGAREAVFVERAAPAVIAIRENIAALGVAARARIEAMSVTRWLAAATRTGTPGAFEVIFLDPPYDEAQEYAGTLDWLGGSAGMLLAESGVVVAEHRRERRGGQAALAEAYGELVRTRQLTQGDAALAFYARKASG